ncbi:MAG: hypothetical protein CMM76_17780 [Rhodospirillaceae bacterium]|nr:hypothetical protein [Rhodospirillaceae bacterium]
MSAEIIRLPKPKRKSVQRAKPRRRVFYAGHRYVGPALCQDVQQIYLKRHGNEEWSLIFYFQGRSWKLDRFATDTLISKLNEYRIEGAPDCDSLEMMGWRNPDRDNVLDFELRYWKRYPDKFCAICGDRLPHNPFEYLECE